MAIEVLSPIAAIRDQVGDHLITPKNSALVVSTISLASWQACGRWIATCCSKTSSPR